MIERPADLQRRGIERFVIEFLYFGVKEARACLFAGLFFLAVFLVPRDGIVGVPRYDLLLIIALAIQVWMIWAKLETLDELKAISVFHLVGFALEVFKTSGNIQSWSYPDFAYTKLFGVWRYPNQLGAWSTVHIGKWSSWCLLVIMTFTIVANLKHIKQSIHVPE